jgi:hypothetical protein
MIPMHEIGWIAGFLEGEGFFTTVGRTEKTPRIEAGQVDIGPIDRLHDRFGGKMWQELRGGVYGRYKGNRQPFWRWYCPPSESVQIMMTIWPLVSTKRRLEIEKCLAIWKGAKIQPGLIKVCKGCGVAVREDTIVQKSREDGKGRRKWCMHCGTRLN